MKQHLRKALTRWQALKVRGMDALHGKALDEYAEALCRACASVEGVAMEYRYRPMALEQMTVHPVSQKGGEGEAVVLQGPVVSDGDFTLETARIYRSLVPRAQVVLSTWDDVPESELDAFGEIGVAVVTSPKPRKSGVGNVNYQVRSTLAGLRRAKEAGALRGIKTRTDQRLLRAGLLDYLGSLVDSFPLGGGYAHLRQRRRLVLGQGTRTGGSMFIPFFLSDFYAYGDIDDLMAYFDFEEQDYGCSRAERAELMRCARAECTVYEYHKRFAPEVLLARNYVTQAGRFEVDETLERSWEFVRSNLVCVSHEDVQLHWPKYQGSANADSIGFGYSRCDGPGRYLTYNWTFQNWLSLHAGRISCTEECEALARRPMAAS